MTSFLLLLFTLIPSITQDLGKEEIRVKNTIVQMFDGMRTGDAAMVEACFLPEASMHTTAVKKDGTTLFKKGALSDFLLAVGTPREEIWNEKILEYKIEVDGTLATAWCPYQFFLDDKLLHCGVNAFQLIKVEDAWKVLHITDTRRKSGCSEQD